MRCYFVFLLLFGLRAKLCWVSSFAPKLPSTIRNHHPTSFQQNVVMYGIQKRGRLTENVSLSSLKKKKRQEKKRKNKNEEKKSSVSSSLAEWATSSTTTNTNNNSIKTSESSSSSAEFVPFEQSNAEEEAKKSKPKQQQISKQTKEQGKAILSIRTLLQPSDTEKKQKALDIDKLLKSIQVLIATENDDSTTKRIFKRQQKQSRDYTLAWVGSDESICHVGTGLHKVPLARMQDVFLSVGGIPQADTTLEAVASAAAGKASKKGGGKWKLMEVIRILGPFPNVRNTLQGQIIDVKQSSKSRIKIRYDSIIDGIGKELKSDGEERIIELTVLFVNEDAIICAVPNSDTKNVLGNDGANVLVFLKENDLETKLKQMRVSEQS